MNNEKRLYTPSSRRSVSRSTRRKLSFSGALPGYGSAAFNYEDASSTSAGLAFGAMNGGQSSKSAGFIKTTLSKGSSYNRNTTNLKGVTLVTEVGGVVDGGVSSSTAGNVVAVGHANVPLVEMHRMMWRAIVKRLFIQSGIEDMSDFDELIPRISTGDEVRVSYRLTPDSTVWSAYASPLTLGTSSFNTVALDLATTFLALNEPNIEFQNIGLWPATAGTTFLNYAVLNLKTCMVHMNGKSTLKIQNRSTESSGGTEESVDNVPLHGRAYFGYGNGTDAITRDLLVPSTGMTFRCNDTNGALAKVPLESFYQEIPPASQFTSVATFGKVVLDPGHVKTSVLSFSKVVPLNSIYRLMFTDASGHSKVLFGKFRFVLLEKMINATTPSLTNSIKVGYEVNNRIGCYVTCKKQLATAQLQRVSNFASVQ